MSSIYLRPSDIKRMEAQKLSNEAARLNRLSGIIGQVGGIVGQVGGLYQMAEEAARVSEVNRQLAYIEQSYQDYNEGLDQQMFDSRGDEAITGPSGGTAPSTVKKAFGQATLADIEADEDKFFQKQLEYITKNTTNHKARQEMIQHLTMKNIQNKAIIARQWNVAAQHEAEAGLGTLFNTILASNDPWEVKLKKFSIRVDQMKAVNRLWPEQAAAWKEKMRSAAQYSFAYKGALSVMKATRNPTAAEVWLKDNTPFFDSDPSKRIEISDEMWRRWGLIKDRENRLLKGAIEKVELNFMDRLQAENPPTWVEIRDSILPRDRKEHYQDLINRMAATAKESETEHIEAERKMREGKEQSAAYLKAYSEIIDWPPNQEEKVEDRILSDELLDNEDKEHLIDEYRQRMSEAADRPENPLHVTDENTLAELTVMFYDDDVPNAKIKSFIETKHGHGLSNADARTWQDKLKKRQPYQVYKLSIDMISQYYDNIIEFEMIDKKEILEARKKEAIIIKQVADEAAKGELTEDGLLQFATNLLIVPKQQRVGGLFSRFETELETKERVVPERRKLPPSDVYDQEMRNRFMAWKGVDPVDIGELKTGEPSFFDGMYWYVYRKRQWLIFDGAKNTWIPTK